ncbi:alkaline phosphatase [Capsulimonas corticalis]|uniref:Alkaline phosphatase n=1 Tax=Capsulimonas corticalis TaxID=2219043 RepID=A0A402D4S9_9BACT|nr:DedA family protein [Capsulimonas corticalis]BDI31993.1 alkaline phosphatase [Capsulimonas corticalis]
MIHLINWVTHLIATLGYPGVVLLMALESACIPIPSEAIMPFAGSLIVTDPARHFNIHVLAFVGAFGNLLGSIVAYWVGAIGGRPFLEKYGKYVLISHHDMDLADRFFQRYGEWTALFSRLLPIVRTFISLPAGIARMNFPKFCLFTFIGALPFCYLLTYAGIKLGEHWHQVHTWLQKADIFIGVIIVALFGLWLWRHLKPSPKPSTN